MNSLIKTLAQFVVVLCIGFGLSGCVTTRVPMATTSPWQVIDLNTQANPLDVSFTNDDHGFLVGSNRLILETNDGGASWNERSLDLPDEENFRLISISFDGDDGWIAGQPGLLSPPNAQPCRAAPRRRLCGRGVRPQPSLGWLQSEGGGFW